MPVKLWGQQRLDNLCDRPADDAVLDIRQGDCSKTPAGTFRNRNLANGAVPVTPFAKLFGQYSYQRPDAMVIEMVVRHAVRPCRWATLGSQVIIGAAQIAGVSDPAE
jgi:hypothetical protein